jgi:hypothetical protein
MSNLNKILITLATAAITAAATAYVDVQLLKEKVLNQQQSIKETHDNVKWLKERWIAKYGLE